MPLTQPGQWGPEAMLDTAGNAVFAANVTVPTGYTSTVDGRGNLTVVGPPADAVPVTVQALRSGVPVGSPWTLHVTVAPQVGDLGVNLAGAVPQSRLVAGHPLTADVTLGKGDVGLGSVDNTSDATKPVSTAQAAADAARLQPRGAWSATTGYVVNDAVTANGVGWRCVLAHTSGASFSADPLKWERMGVGQVLASAPSSPAVDDLWFDKANDLWKRWNGTSWVPSGSATYQTITSTVLAWAYAQSFQVVSATRDANEAITTASVVWPDGATGTFTTDTASTAFPGAIDAYHVTHVLGGVTTTYTQPAVTRDSGGAVTAQPAITVA